MTEVRLDQSGLTFTVEAVGHAGSEAGCAAVSTLMYTLAGWLRNVKGQCEVLEERLEDGDACVKFRARSWTILSLNAVQAAYDLICIGFLQLADSYPEQVRATRTSA